MKIVNVIYEEKQYSMIENILFSHTNSVIIEQIVHQLEFVDMLRKKPK